MLTLVTRIIYQSSIGTLVGLNVMVY